MERHVGFGTGDPADTDEKYFARIANPTVSISLNELRKVVNALIKKYGLPSVIMVEVEAFIARALNDSAHTSRVAREYLTPVHTAIQRGLLK